MENVSFELGSILLIEKINKEFGIIDDLFGGIGGRSKFVKESVKLFINNRLGKCVSTNKLLDFYPPECLKRIGFKEIPKERTLYRDLVRVGKSHLFILEKYQKMIEKFELASNKQFVDFSSSYFEGNDSELGALGYSRDHEPGKKQLVFGIATGINQIPIALTIQKGNVCDKEHFKFMLKTASKILKEKSLLIFDCGANTKKNKEKILKQNFNYLTLKAKHKKVYQKYKPLLENEQEKSTIVFGERKYDCAKLKEDNEFQYIFFSEELKQNQLRKKEKKFQKMLDKNGILLEKVKKGKSIGSFTTREGEIIAKGELQKKLSEIENYFITGIEGFFILESSVDESPEKILQLYKDKDKVEKLIRDIKEGTELRPIRHWSTDAVMGYILIVFLANCINKLTQFLNGNSDGKNLKLLKKYLSNLTVTVIYRRDYSKFSVLSNISQEIRDFLGDFLEEYIRKPPDF